MAGFQSVLITSTSKYSQNGTIEIGVTDGDAEGQVYLETSDRVYFKPNDASSVRASLKDAIDQATLDAANQRITIKIASNATDAQIVAAVRAAMA